MWVSSLRVELYTCSQWNHGYRLRMLMTSNSLCVISWECMKKQKHGSSKSRNVSRNFYIQAIVRKWRTEICDNTPWQSIIKMLVNTCNLIGAHNILFYKQWFDHVPNPPLPTTDCLNILANYSTVELQWLEHWRLVYPGCFELILEFLGKNNNFGWFSFFILENGILCLF